MEKKQNLRTNLVPAKVLSSDSRKSNQVDVPGKQQTRNSRRREYSSNFSQLQKHSGNSQYKQQQQPQQQLQQQQQQYQLFAPKSRATDAKRNNYTANSNSNNANNSADNGNRNAINHDGYTRIASSSSARLSHDDDDAESFDDDFGIEPNSVYLKQKKQNLNHLLNFNYAPRDRNDAATFMRSGNLGKCQYVKRVKYNKEQFLQANCQFVVKSDGNYEMYAVSPDLLVEWSSIEQINFFGSSEEPQCPICLYHPVAAKMTRCGHVYCWPCILHYLALSDKKSWRKCPICYEAVHIGDLKSAVSKPHRNYNCSETVTFQLMYRNKNSLQIYNAEDKLARKSSPMQQFPYLSDDANNMKHSKLVLAQPHEIMTIIERERRELKCQLVSDGIDCPDSIFVQQALCLLEEREKNVCADFVAETKHIDCNNRNNANDEPSVVGLDEAIDQISLNADAKEFIPFDTKDDKLSSASSSDDSGDYIIDADSELTLKDIDIVPVNTATNQDCFFFYQASDGQHLYLHSINVRMLQTMYGSLELAPKTIDGRIVQKESCSMTEELRKRLKYLQHLPATCQFDVVEIELKSPAIISDEIFTKFKDELKQRQKNRQRRAREERLREKHIDRENERRIGKIIHSGANIDVTSVQEFPTCGSFDESSFPLQLSSNEMDNVAASNSVSSASSAGPSFAKMLTSPMSANKVESWPTLGRPKEMPFAAQSSTSPFKATKLEPNHTNGLNMNVGTTVEHSDEDSVDFANDDLEALYARPELNASFGASIAEALNKAAHSKNPRKQQNEPANDRNVGSKKKKNKKTILFSTGSHMGGK